MIYRSYRQTIAGSTFTKVMGRVWLEAVKVARGRRSQRTTKNANWQGASFKDKGCDKMPERLVVSVNNKLFICHVQH